MSNDEDLRRGVRALLAGGFAELDDVDLVKVGEAALEECMQRATTGHPVVLKLPEALVMSQLTVEQVHQVQTNPLQAMADAIGRDSSARRSRTQLTLGGLIEFLEGVDGERFVVGLTKAHSYRGYYTDLAFEPTEGRETVADFLDRCRRALGAVFQGYKGGDYVMHESTPVWCACYGSTGVKVYRMMDTGSGDVVRPVLGDREDW